MGANLGIAVAPLFLVMFLSVAMMCFHSSVLSRSKHQLFLICKVFFYYVNIIMSPPYSGKS